ncbi:probable ADP-ribosylation factor GTPase-activating protein AGD14 [Elaeis guineensis]|uniref:Probable ADP-ribosylation factor GTPase-activating protein AGD14 n=1 Tax=Elaeis guineensis var. tenera TaxID=51953 RepID=A0A6I9Q8H2_ELAGV|nr:probable ADP-ribosylation factor GTPase-activating protein AGD14 [Elaeis guineensis]XP_010904973.1 probable ADP-ribosylation factor GTPase-activating protein AGD14 [Elaeis guineensis]XP_010904974.1 probable ADP-ribosylation factor GTPase-activating protein AGD14 [Elaeis guineensis]
MSSKREEERNEKIIRGLLKLPPNRKCINCGSLGPQYVCTTFWTFVCMTCSGIHREFTHRVKSVSLAKFTTQEVEALQKGGNQRAREMFLKDWDSQQMRLPDSSNVDRIREFIKNVYVDKKYARGRSSDKPPRDMQSHKNHEEEHRRASSYHSFSQSPPYEHQYEERRYGKQTGILSRKPGSDRGYYEGKVSSFIYSPGRQGEQMYEDRFANESYASRNSDYSVSSTGDPFRFDGQSPNFQDVGYNSPPLQQVRDILIEDGQSRTLNTYSEANVKRGLDGIPHPQRTASSGSCGSIESNSISLKSANSFSLIDTVPETERASGTLQSGSSTSLASQLSASAHAMNQDPFSLSTVQQTITSSTPSIDLFAHINNQSSSTTPSELKMSAVPLSENVGWATFDLPHQVGPTAETTKGLPSAVPPGEEAPKVKNDLFASVSNDSQWFSIQNSSNHGTSSSIADQQPVSLHEVKGFADTNSSQSWNAFDDSTWNIPQTSLSALPQTSEPQIPAHNHPASADKFTGLNVSEVPARGGLQKSAIDELTAFDGSFSGVAGSSFSSSVPPSMGGTTQERKSTNPFDLAYDSEPEASNMFLDMSSLQAALPDQQLPNAFLGGLSQTWFPQNSVPTYVPSVSQGGLAFMAGHVPGSQLPNIPAQGSISSLGGNPFA